MNYPLAIAIAMAMQNEGHYRQKTGRQGYVGIGAPTVEAPNLTEEEVRNIAGDMPWYQKLGNAITGGQLLNKKISRINEQNVGRGSVGLEEDEAIKASNQAIARQIQMQINQNIATANRQFGPTRFNSGQREKAITDIMGQGTTAMAQAVGGNTLQAQLALAQMAEERAWRQAQIDMSNQTDRTGTAGNIMNLIAMLMVNNPQLAGNVWNWAKTGTWGTTPSVSPFGYSYSGPEGEYF